MFVVFIFSFIRAVSIQFNFKKLTTNLIDCHPFRVETKNIGELWSINKQVAGADVDTP